MTPPPKLFHSLLRPAVLQILRAVGYHSAKTSVLDSMTDMAARYLTRLCELTAIHASLNSSIDHARVGMLDGPEPPVGAAAAAAAAPYQSPSVPAPSIVDIRLALQELGVLLPEKVLEEQEYLGMEDTRGLDQFIAWAAGSLNKEIQRIALDGNDEAHDYLDALKKKHSKNDDDTKFLGTVLGKPHEQGDVVIEGGKFPSITAWEAHMKAANVRPVLGKPQINGDAGEDSRPPSSRLSTLSSMADEIEMEIDG